jgi:hypothetical protein
MKSSLAKSLLAGFVMTTFFVVSSASLAETIASKAEEALSKKNITEVQSLLATNPASVDDVIKALLKRTQKDMASDPIFAEKMMAVAGQYAASITPPSVPAVCADLRRIVDTLKPEQAATPLFKAVLQASESFSKAPVVVAAGRPNECEQAYLQINTMGEEALLAQTPGMRGPGLPVVTVGPGTKPTPTPGIPPSTPSPEDKPSAD